MVVDAPYLVDDLYQYWEEPSFSALANDADILLVGEDGERTLRVKVARTDVVCWYHTLLGFDLAFPPELLSKTDARCRDFEAVRQNYINRWRNVYRSLIIYDPGKEPRVLSLGLDPTSTFLLLAQKYPTEARMRQMVTFNTANPEGVYRARKSCKSSGGDCNDLAAAREEDRRAAQGSTKRQRAGSGRE
jgi:hypothetical protein